MSEIKRTDLHELDGSVSQLNEVYRKRLEKHLMRLEDAELRLELYKVCLRGVRHELGAIDADRFKSLIGIIDDVLTK